MTDKNNIDYWLNEVHQGDSREKLKEMPEESVDMVVTSPPYYGLRDYGDDVESIWGGEDDCKHDWGTVTKKPRGGNNTEENPPDVGGNEHTQETRLRGGDGIESNYCSKCGAWKGQLGLEPSPIQFVRNITEICNEIYRVLKPEGSFYLNLGDTYAGGGGISGVPDDWDSASTQDREKYPDSVPARDVEFPDKCKMLIPHRTAISLMDNGWIEDGVVLDPFIGSGTTAVVAEQLDRDWIGIDLNKDYVDMSFDRIENETTKIFDDRSIMDY